MKLPPIAARLLLAVLTLAATLAATLVSAAATAPAAPAAAATTVPASHTGYWLVARDGGLFAFGGAPFDGSMGGHPLNKPVVGMAGGPSGAGYWEVASDGGIFAFGSAQFYGSMGGQPLNKPIVGMASTPTGGGYWLVASDGGIFAFGNAQFYGSMGGRFLNKPIVGMAATPTGGGYWLVASDGGIFAFGNAQFYGSMGGTVLNQPVTGMAAAPTGHGYWEVATDGGMFSFGSATFHGSLGGAPQPHPVIGMAALYQNTGYWLVNTNGLVTNYGTAIYWGSAPQVLNQPIVGIAAAAGNGDPTNMAYPSGSTGYDISNWQCGNLPPAPHQIGVVEVNGSAQGPVNPCLSTEAHWSGGGLSLYTFLTFGQATHSTDAACKTTHTPAACNFGYNSALTAFNEAKNAGITALIPWWLDVEGKNTFWTTKTTAHGVTNNAAVVQGEIDGFRAEGVNSVGFYFSASKWNTIVGNFNPPGPLWVASWWTTTPSSSSYHQPTPRWTCTNGRSFWASQHVTWPSGPVELVQYTDNATNAAATAPHFDGDYAC